MLLADFNERTWKVIGTTALLGGFSLLGLPGAALLDQGRAVALGWANLLLAGIGLIYSLVLLWSEAEGDTGWKLLLVVVSFGGATAQASGTTARRRDDDPQSVNALYVAGVAGSFLIASLVTLAVWQEIEDEGFYRMLGALAVAEVLVVLLQPILRRTSKRAPAATAPGEASFVCTLDDGREVNCPDELASAISELEHEGARIVKIERR